MTTTTSTTTLTTWKDFQPRLQAAVEAGLPAHVDRLRWSSAQIEAAQRTGLARLLQHATEHSPFHRGRLVGVDLSSVDPSDLSSLPVMTKGEMMDSLDDVFTDRRLTRARVEAALAATGSDPVPILGEYLTLASGGSSGHRGVFVFDLDALAAFQLSIARPIMARLMQLGGPPPGGLPIAIVAAGSPVHATGLAPHTLRGPEAPFCFTSIPVTSPLPEIVDRLNDLQPTALVGYASILSLLAAEQRAGRLRIEPFSVTSTSETLLSEVRAAVTDAFGVPVVNTFGATEGLIGSTPPGDEVLVFNTDLCIVELVDDENQPVAAGEASSKILLTNLANHTQPLIRYEITDCFLREPDAPEHGFLRARVQGRSDDVLHYRVDDQEVDVHPLVVRSVLVKESEVVDYQVRQTPKGIDVDVVADGETDTEGLAQRLRTALEDAGLVDPVVAVRPVEELGRHHETGKLRRFVPLPA